MQLIVSDVLSSFPPVFTMSFIVASDYMEKERLRPLYYVNHECYGYKQSLVMPLNAAKLTRDVAMEQTPINYHLSGMILYYGIVLCIHSYQGKHYVAMCLYEYQGRFYWMECNDTKFRHFEDNASMIDHCVQAAYQPILLFYRKDEVSQNAGGNALSLIHI